MTSGVFGRTYVDSNAFIYAIEFSPENAEAALAMFAELERQGETPVTSEFTIAECLMGARKGGLELESLYLSYFADERSINLRPLPRDLIIASARIACDQGLKLADAIHVATAIAAGCQSFVTNDRKLGQRLPESLRWASLNPTPPAGS